MLRKIATYRDGHHAPPPFPIQSNQDLVRLVNGLNAAGVAFGRRLSTRLLVDLLDTVGLWATDLLERLPLYEPALWAVSWAGETESFNWMDLGREYTEWWHHQMQIRDAIGEPRLLAPQWMEPLIEFSVRALPVAYAGYPAPDGVVVTLEVHTPNGGAWSVVRDGGHWRIVRGRPQSPDALVRISADDAWRLLFNAVGSPGLESRVEFHGNRELGQPLLQARSVIV